jgi:hypothetical protein
VAVMKLSRLFFLLALAVSSPTRAEEISIPGSRDMTAPFKGKLLETFLAGSPPSILTSCQYNLGLTSCKAAVWYEGEDTPTSEIRPSMMIIPWSGLDSVDSFNAVFSPAEGIYILHDKEGRVSQAWSEVLVVNFERGPKTLKATAWPILDTCYGGDIPGSRMLLPGKKSVWSWVVKEVSKDETKGVLETLEVTTSRDGSVHTTHSTFNNNAKRAMLVSEVFTGPEPRPEALVSRETFQRIYWPEGPGIRQMIQGFAKDASGNLAPVKDVDEYWKVSPEGVRTLASRKDKQNP